jgi:hypothetical protein
MPRVRPRIGGELAKSGGQSSGQLTRVASRHCEEPFDAACGVAQDELPLRGSDEAIQLRRARHNQDWIASLRSQ